MMNNLIEIEEYEHPAVAICPNGTQGEAIELGGLVILLPAKPPKKQISGYDLPKHLQVWQRRAMPEEMSRIKSMDEWLEMPREFRQKFRPYIEEEFRRRREGFGFIITVSLHILRGATT